jgi:hypothetical protein
MALVNVFAGQADTDDPTLSEATITFNTPDGGDDKDDNTKLQITLSTKFGGGFVRKIAFSGFQTHGRFADGSVVPINLPVQGVVRLSTIGDIKLKIEFEPDGDDTWKFKYGVDLKFSDGTVLNKSSDSEKLLSDGNRLLEE